MQQNQIVTPNFSGVLRTTPSLEKPKEMLSVVKDGLQTYVKVNSSSLSLLQTCARKSMYTLRDGWRSRNGSPPLIFGTAIHKALEVFYSHPAHERTIPDGFEENAFAMVQGDWTGNDHFLYQAISAFLKAGALLQNLPDTDPRSLSSGVWVLGHYFKTYLHDSYVIHSDDAGPVVERYFCVPFYEDATLKIDLHGQIDFVLKNKITGEILPGDHKSTSQMGSQFLSRLKPNHQYTGYLFGAQAALGLTGNNFLVNGIQTKARPLTARGGPPTFTRQITSRDDQDFAEFKDVVLESVNNYLRWDKTNTWPLGVVDACAAWGSCSFQDVCGAPNMLRNNILENKFERQEA